MYIMLMFLAAILPAAFLFMYIYDSLAMSGMVNRYIGGLCFIVLIYFCIKMHKVAKGKVLTLVEKDRSENDFIVS